MTFTINRESLARELTLLQSVAERKGTIPVLSTVLMELADGQLRLTASDCDVFMQSAIEASGDPWSGCVPMTQIAALTRLLEGEAVTLTPKPNDRVEVKCGESRHLLLTLAASEFPVPNEAGEGAEVVVDGEALRLALRRVLPCVSTEEGRWQMQGASFEFAPKLLRLVATMGHRLAVAEIQAEIEVEAKMIVPPVALNALLKLDGDVTIRTATNNIAFVCGSRTISSRLLIGQFPNWEMIMPANQPHSIQFNAEELQTALRRVAVTREERYKAGVGMLLGGVRLDFSSDRIRITTNANDKGESEEWVAARSNLNGEGIAMGMNPDYLSDFLTLAKGEVNCGLSDGGSQLLLTLPDDPNYRHTICPMRL